MLHYLTCAAIAYCMALYLNARWPHIATAIWSGPASVVVGLFAGSTLVIGGLGLAGVPVDAGQAMQRIFGQALIWSVAGAAAGIYLGRKKGLTGAHEAIGSIPMRAWVGWGALTVVSFIVVASLIGQVIPQKHHTAPAPSAAQSVSTVAPAVLEAAPAAAPTPLEVQPPAVKTQTAEEIHLQKIYAAHPDADAIFESPGFRDWLSRAPKYQRIAKEGSAQDVIAMFSAYKRALAKPAEPWSAETVRRNEAAAEALARRYGGTP